MLYLVKSNALGPEVEMRKLILNYTGALVPEQEKYNQEQMFTIWNTTIFTKGTIISSEMKEKSLHS